MSSVPLFISTNGGRMTLSGVLDDSEEVVALLTKTFKQFVEEEETNRILGKPDDPEYEEWERTKKDDVPEDKFHINSLFGPIYKSVIIDAENMQLGNGGLNIWMKLIQEHLGKVSLRYDQSVLAEVLQYASFHYTHAHTTFLCQPEPLLDKKRAIKQASAYVEKYHFVLEKQSDESWIGCSLEQPLGFSTGKTAQECINNAIEMQTRVTALLVLGRGHKPKTPINNWRQRWENSRDE